MSSWLHRHAYLLVIFIGWAAAFGAMVDRSRTIWPWLFGAPIAVGGAFFTAVAIEFPLLQLPRIEALDLRPQWQHHPSRDMARRGERAWRSMVELAAVEHVTLSHLR